MLQKQVLITFWVALNSILNPLVLRVKNIKIHQFKPTFTGLIVKEMVHFDSHNYEL